MPRTSQIIPEHLYPSQTIVVNDNTIVTPDLPVESGDTKMLFVFASPRGEDGKVRTIENGVSEFVKDYGLGSFSLYGQSLLNAYNAFSTGEIIGHCLRITALNANYACSHLVARYKITDNVMNVRFETKMPTEILDELHPENKTIVPLTDLAELGTHYTSPATAINVVDDPDNGYTEVKIMSVAPKGKGIYGKNLGYRIVSNSAADKENSYKNYLYQIYESYSSTPEQKEEYQVVFSDDAIINDNSVFAGAVINDPDEGSERVIVEVYAEGIKALFDAYKSVNPDTTLTIDDFDIFLGVNKYSKVAIENYTVDTTSSHVIDVKKLGGIFLEGGSDGDFGEDVTASVRTTAMNARFLAAFNGDIDPLIKSKNKFPTHIMLDAGYDIPTKIAFAALVNKRGDCFGVLDCGTTISTKQSVISYVKENLDQYVSTNHLVIDAYCGKVKDPYSRKIVTLTSTYGLASAYPVHFATYGGKHIPLAGNQYGVIDGYLNHSIYPIFDEDIDSDIMDELCEENINFARINVNQDTIIATQTTRQKVLSNLSEASNVMLLLDIARDCTRLCSMYDYNFSETSDIARFNRDAEVITSKYPENMVKSIGAAFGKNTWEAERSILHMYVDLVHKDLVKRTLIEIDVNRASL